MRLVGRGHKSVVGALLCTTSEVDKVDEGRRLGGYGGGEKVGTLRGVLREAWGYIQVRGAKNNHTQNVVGDALPPSSYLGVNDVCRLVHGGYEASLWHVRR